jgi:hypothetical protein
VQVFSAEGRQYYADVADMMPPEDPIDGPLTVVFRCFMARRGSDVDSRAKAALDALEKAGLIQNDAQGLPAIDRAPAGPLAPAPRCADPRRDVLGTHQHLACCVPRSARVWWRSAGLLPAGLRGHTCCSHRPRVKPVPTLPC